MLAQKRSPTTSPSASSPAAPPPTTSPASASTFAWTGPPSSSQGTYSRSTSRRQTSKTYSTTSNGGWGQKQPKTNSTRHADDHSLTHPCRKRATRNSGDLTRSGRGECETTGGGKQLGSSVGKMDLPPSTSTSITAASTTPSPCGTGIEVSPFQTQRRQSGLRTLVRMSRDSQP